MCGAVVVMVCGRCGVCVCALRYGGVDGVVCCAGCGVVVRAVAVVMVRRGGNEGETPSTTVRHTGRRTGGPSAPPNTRPATQPSKSNVPNG